MTAQTIEAHDGATSVDSHDVTLDCRAIMQKNAGLLVVLNGGGERAEAAISALDGLLRARIAASP